MTFVVVRSLTPQQVDDLMDLYQCTYWAKDRDVKAVERMLSSSEYLFGAVEQETGRLCGFARVVSDHVYRAFVLDVVVHPEFRGRGLIRLIFGSILEHPEIKDMECFLLFCKVDVVKLYQRFGFDAYEDMYLMRRTTGSQTE